MSAYLAPVVSLYEASVHRRSLFKTFLPVAQLSTAPQIPARVPVSFYVRREGVPSVDYLATLAPDLTPNAHLAIFIPSNGQTTQWFAREAIYLPVIAQAFEYTEPRLGMTRWPTVSETADSFLFNITEGSGGNQVSTVDARVEVITAVDSLPAVREVALVEKMDDGQWRVAGYGYSEAGVFKSLDLKVTTSGTLYAIGMDDYGKRFASGIALAVGERVRPTQYAGWLYEVTQAGELPSVEPEWWPASDVNPSRLVGTVWLKAVRYYQPVAHGPVPVEFV